MDLSCKVLHPYLYYCMIIILFIILIQISPGEENKKMVIDYQHFIVSSQSTYQKQCTATLEASSTVFVEGPISLWMNHVREEYFILKTGRRSLLSTDHLQIAPDEEREGKLFVIDTLICYNRLNVLKST